MSRELALSTCWNSHRHTDGEEMLQEIADLGFEYAELSHGVRMSLAPGIMSALVKGIVKIQSVHVFCPLPAGVNAAAPNLYQPTAADKRERILWERHAKRTVEFAAQTGAQLVVVHSGSMRLLFQRPGRYLEFAAGDRSQKRLREDEAYKKLVEKTLAKLSRKKRRPHRRLVESLRKLTEFAKEKGVRLGIENRESVMELPLDREMPALLEELGEPETVGYWHDSGHACLKEGLLAIEPGQLLEENRERLMGFHLHDVSVDGQDHSPIGEGMIDWEALVSHIRPHHLLTLEMSPRLQSAEVAESRDYLLELLES